MTTKFIAYYRVSTDGQGRSGLGLDAQRHAVRSYLAALNPQKVDQPPIVEFIEVESAKRSDNRPQLKAALDYAELTGSTLVIAKLDRLSRNAAFLMTLKDAGVDFMAVDNPHANRLTIGILALVAQDEAERISERTKAALAAAKRRGTVLGGDRCGIASHAAKAALASAVSRSRAARDRSAKVMPLVDQARSDGHVTVRQIAAYLNARGILTPRGKPWLAGSVQRLIAT